ncbi:hypothetical protein [Lentzea sp. NPDC003310]|uniref:hypothetical protein n=1 Tax=Lentzea sp. NPDC003310 TaxID=3154447 RepID=UPI0033BD270B
MRNALTRTAIGLVAAAALAAAVATPASAAAGDPGTGLSFYGDREFVANFPQPDTGCHLVPAGSDLLVGWSGLTNVVAYSTPDCTGQATSLGTLRSLDSGDVSFRTQ